MTDQEVQLFLADLPAGAIAVALLPADSSGDAYLAVLTDTRVGRWRPGPVTSGSRTWIRRSSGSLS